MAVPTPIEDRPTRPQLLQVGKVRRILVFAAIAAVLFGGAGRELIESLVDGLSGNDTPNIPVHILEACNEAFADQEGPAASFGQAYQYEQRADGTEDVLFRTAQGSEWDCRWDPTAFTAEITATRQAG
ncbi:MAG TPA: hypothetical protein ENH15_03970 [Actinobacteria bacterium]|nr:hypothetical protein [Actinomycetota bacterium]